MLTSTMSFIIYDGWLALRSLGELRFRDREIKQPAELLFRIPGFSENALHGLIEARQCLYEGLPSVGSSRDMNPTGCPWRSIARTSSPARYRVA
ncbi:MAG: hypothetical protein C4345_04465 [Chloroflexota bacterium]